MTANNALTRHVEIAVVGAGFAGIGLGVKLREAGFEDFVILERAEAVGGTWRANTYPGCACDVPSALYSYSFAPNPDWSRRYGTQPEILAYLTRVAEQHGVPRHVEFGTELLDAAWDETAGHWRLRTGRGDLTATVLIPAVGPFAEAQIPDIPGRASFAGTQFHSLHWDHDHDLTGRRIAVVGTGASAVQFIPEIQPLAAHLTVFQRSAPWIVPRMDWRTSRLGAALRRVPVLGKAERGVYFTGIESFGLVGFVDTRFRYLFESLGRLQLLRQVRDPALRRKLTPDYVIGCKRAIFSDAYYPALTQPNVEVVTAGIDRIEPDGIVTTDGVEHRVDTLIWGTGFALPPAVFGAVRGREGVSLAELHRRRPRAYLGVSVAGFPNAFLTLGPFGAAGNQSAIYMIEAQIGYIVDALTTMRARGIRRFEVRADVQDAFVRNMEERSRDTVWLTGGCQSYYTTPDGTLNSGLYPDWSFHYARRTRSFDLDAYEVRTQTDLDTRVRA
ncbi:flavin-containing monooxygenase [Nocardia farcinica]|uniref:flavin-containing monooxygenase n=1 Tax=Nocardia farcinica TaxID=37329 RepID=UPI001895E7C7|nr:NAD(P)/FAD-dependent oxidoreductase [Nocardia farcinica]MBF6520277.1 NAD(P)/FAD-dependent oxidoreductase [Nocardia farcinica]